MTISECYIVLEIAPTQDTRRIRTQYLRLAKVWHPDLNTDSAAQRKFQDIQLAYNTLIKAIESGTINQVTATYRATSTTNTAVDPRAQARARREKVRIEQERIREEKINVLAKKHMGQYIEMLTTNTVKKNRILFYFIATLGLINTLIVLSGIAIGFYFFGLLNLIVTIGILLFSALPMYYYLLFLNEFYFIINKSKPKVKFNI